MAYVTQEFYESIYGSGKAPENFENLSWEASRVMDNYTTGADGVKKLRKAYPTDLDDDEAVKRCCCKLIEIMDQVAVAEAAAGYVEREDGTVVKKAVSSVSSGAESITYESGQAASLYAAAAADLGAREKLFRDTVRKYLSGAEDANGVRLLYMGRYPAYVC